jgi:hypothetical protein
MQDGSGDPEEGATRFAADGALEVFDGKVWAPYKPLVDDGFGAVFKGAPLPEPPTDDSGTQ